MELTKKDQIKEITRKYLGEKKLDDFAREMGIPSDRQRVWMWKSGQQAPSIDTLLAVLMSSTASTNAQNWAKDCLQVLRPGMTFITAPR